MKLTGCEWNIDYLRIFACFMVIILHVSADNWHTADVDSFEWAVFNFYDTAVRSCVPLFFMISGKLFLGRTEIILISKLYKKNIGKF